MQTKRKRGKDECVSVCLIFITLHSAIRDRNCRFTVVVKLLFFGGRHLWCQLLAAIMLITAAANCSVSSLNNHKKIESLMCAIPLSSSVGRLLNENVIKTKCYEYGTWS